MRPTSFQANAKQVTSNLLKIPGPGFFCLWVCGFVGLWVCGVVGLWGCGVVGLWCVCVCFIGRVGPKKLQKSIGKKRRKKRSEPRIRRNARRSQRLSFQKISFGENKKESQLKGGNKVECKKWSAKGTYRKASADREPTQDLTPLGA